MSLVTELSRKDLRAGIYTKVIALDVSEDQASSVDQALTCVFIPDEQCGPGAGQSAPAPAAAIRTDLAAKINFG
jgi:hypothetical protein